MRASAGRYFGLGGQRPIKTSRPLNMPACTICRTLHRKPDPPPVPVYILAMIWEGRDVYNVYIVNPGIRAEQCRLDDPRVGLVGCKQ